MQIGKRRIPDIISYIPTASTTSDRFQTGCCVVLINGRFVELNKSSRFNGIHYYTMKFKTI